MIELSKKFPNYLWNENKGYPTKKHRLAISRYGITGNHRKSFKLT
jgi:ribonuclease HII